MSDNNNSKKSPFGKVITAIVVLIFLAAAAVIMFLATATERSVRKEMEDHLKIDSSKYDTSIVAVIKENRKTGTSVGEGMDANPVDAYTPIYEYEFNGNTYTVSGSLASSNPKYSVGEKVSIRISSDDPEKMYDPNYNSQTVYNSFKKEIKTMFLIPALLSLVFIIGAIAAVVIIVRRQGLVYGGTQQSGEQENYDPNDDYRG